jgi:hypothetical protein
MPIITIDQTGANWNRFGSPPNRELAFNTGTIHLTLGQEVLIVNDRSPCARGVWTNHENLHVRGNADILTRMPRRFTADPSLRAIRGPHYYTIERGENLSNLIRPGQRPKIPRIP